MTLQLVDSNERCKFLGGCDELKRARYLNINNNIDYHIFGFKFGELLFQIIQNFIETSSLWWINFSFWFFLLIMIYPFQKIVDNPLIYWKCKDTHKITKNQIFMYIIEKKQQFLSWVYLSNYSLTITWLKTVSSNNSRMRKSIE